jgi:hypothetical protein
MGAVTHDILHGDDGEVGANLPALAGQYWNGWQAGQTDAEEVDQARDDLGMPAGRAAGAEETAAKVEVVLAARYGSVVAAYRAAGDDASAERLRLAAQMTALLELAADLENRSPDQFTGMSARMQSNYPQ